MKNDGGDGEERRDRDSGRADRPERVQYPAAFGHEDVAPDADDGEEDRPASCVGTSVVSSR